MGFRDKAFASVWDVRPSSKSVSIRLSTSRQTGTNPDGTGIYETDFSSWVLFVKDTAESAKTLQPNDRIQLLSTDCLLTWDKVEQKENRRFLCYDFKKVEPLSGNGSKKTAPPKQKKEQIRETKIEFPDEDQDEELPFM